MRWGGGGWEVGRSQGKGSVAPEVKLYGSPTKLKRGKQGEQRVRIVPDSLAGRTGED